MVSPKNGALDRVVGSFYDVVSDSRRWTQDQEGLQQCLGVLWCVWTDFGFSNRIGNIRRCAANDLPNIRGYRQTISALIAWFYAGVWYTSGEVSFGEAINSPKELIETGFYTKWLSPKDFFYRLCAIVKSNHEHIVYLEAMRL